MLTTLETLSLSLQENLGTLAWKGAKAWA